MKDASDLDNTGLEHLPGAGASGGIVAGFKCFFKNCQTRSGIEMISELTNFEEKLKNSDLLITGEGMFDNQTLDGKVISSLLKTSKKQEKPVIIL